MIIYSRDLNKPARTTPQFLESYRGQLNFLPWLHQRRNNKLLKYLKKKWFREFLADVGASALNQMVYRHHIGPKSGIGGKDPNWKPIADHLSELFDQRVQSLGFKMTLNAKEWRTTHPGKTLVIIAGGQRAEIYRLRAQAAVKLVMSADLREAHIVFSGANPIKIGTRTSGPATEAQTIEEAAALRAVFETGLPTAAARNLKLQLTEETEAASTRENIVNSLKRLETTLDEFKQLVVVSSSFHVPRLATEVESVLGTRNYPFTALTLVGSELFGNSIMWHRHYFKSACYEAINLLFENHQDPTHLVKPPQH